MDLKSITRDDVEKAIGQIMREGMPIGFGPSTVYDLIHNGTPFAPKAVLAIAHKIANGVMPKSDDFSGGEGTPCFTTLRKLGFNISRKNPEDALRLTSSLIAFANGYLSAKASMSRFSEQHEKLKTIGKKLEELLRASGYVQISVKSAVGQGTFADVPWICIFDDRVTDKASSGHYPVYLFSADMRSMYLAYCISNGMMLNDPEKANRARVQIRQSLSSLTDLGFKEAIDLKSKLATPRGYEKGTLTAKKYDFQSINPEEFLTDLTTLLGKYQEIAEHTEENLNKINNKTMRGQKMNLIQKLSAACSSKPFTILAGGTGTGKTRSAKLAAASIAGVDNVEVVAVGADWTDNRPLLGFRNLLSDGGKTYVAPPALRIILKALKNPVKPFFLILDEMNLSHVERYFSDFLSSMESKEKIKLHDSAQGLHTEDGVLIDGKIDWPTNLFIIGTVNIDETTYMFSPKVLDRAHVIEFKVSWDEIQDGLEGAVPSELLALSPEKVDEFMRVSQLKEKALPADDYEQLMAVLKDLHKSLEGSRFIFAHRTARECLNFVASAQALVKADMVAPSDTKSLIDLAILQKALPKLNGGAGTLSKVLDELIKVADKHDLDLSKEKLESMSRQLKADQFVSFIQ
jgi:5-methylcytosine-specific restriction protein B